MSSPHHDSAHEERLFELLAGAEDPTRALEGSELGECPECLELARELAEVERRVEHAGQGAQASLEAADRGERAPHEDWVDAFGAELLRGSATPRSSRRGLLLALGTAAAASVAVVLWRATRPPEIDPDVTLGGGGPTLVEPVGRVDDFGSFHWEGALPPGGWYRLLVREDSGGTQARTLADVHPLSETRWSPSAETTEPWGEHVLWEVRVLDASGMEVARESASATRSSSSH